MTSFAASGSWTRGVDAWTTGAADRTDESAGNVDFVDFVAFIDEDFASIGAARRQADRRMLETDILILTVQL